MIIFREMAASSWEWLTTKTERGQVYSLHKSIGFSIHREQYKTYEKDLGLDLEQRKSIV